MNLNTNLNNLGVSQGTGVYGNTTASVSPPANHAQNTLSPSDKEQIDLVIATMSPMLAPPATMINDFPAFFASSGATAIGGSSSVATSNANIANIYAQNATTSFLLAMAQKMNEIITQVLDSWLDSLKQQAKQLEEELNSSSYLAAQAAKASGSQAQYQNYLNSLPADQKAQVIDFDTRSTNVAGMSNIAASLLNEMKGFGDQVTSNVSQNSADSISNFTNLSVVTLGVMLGGSALAGARTITDPSTNQVGMNPVIDATNQATATLLPPNVQDIANMAINLFAVPLMVFATNETVAKAAGTGEKPKDVAYGREFAAKVVALVTNNDLFDKTLMAILINRPENGQPMTQERKTELTAQLKIIFLASALAMLYKLELQDAGRITDIEMAAILTGNMKLKGPNAEIMLSMRTLIMGDSNNPLKPGLLAQITPAERNKFLNSLLSFMDTNPSIKDLSNPAANAVNLMFDQVEDPSIQNRV